MDPATSDPAALGLKLDPRADDAGGLSGARAGRGGVGSALSKLSDAERAQLLSLSKERQWAHVEKVEELLMSREGMTVAEADRLAYGMVPGDAPIHHSARHDAAAGAGQQQK